LPTPRKALHLCLAALCFALAVAGVVLPGLPTTPFLLLTSWCLVRSSPRLDARLRASSVFGPLLADWERERGVRAGVKRLALAWIAIGVALSLYFGGLPWPAQALVLAAAAYGAWFVWRLPTVVDRAVAPDPDRAP